MSHVEAPRLYQLVTHLFFDGQVTMFGDGHSPIHTAVKFEVGAHRNLCGGGRWRRSAAERIDEHAFGVEHRSRHICMRVYIDNRELYDLIQDVGSCDIRSGTRLILVVYGNECELGISATTEMVYREPNLSPTSPHVAQIGHPSTQHKPPAKGTF